MTQYINKAAVVAEIRRIEEQNPHIQHGDMMVNRDRSIRCNLLEDLLDFLNTLEVKEVDFERELSKYVSNGIHRFFPNVDDDYCKMESFIWQDYVIETAKYFFELGLKAQKGE